MNNPKTIAIQRTAHITSQRLSDDGSCATVTSAVTIGAGATAGCTIGAVFFLFLFGDPFTFFSYWLILNW